MQDHKLHRFQERRYTLLGVAPFAQEVAFTRFTCTLTNLAHVRRQAPQRGLTRGVTVFSWLSTQTRLTASPPSTLQNVPVDEVWHFGINMKNVCIPCKQSVTEAALPQLIDKLILAVLPLRFDLIPFCLQSIGLHIAA
jgi:hypothetical protein